MYEHENYILGLVMAVVSVWIVNRFWGSFFERKKKVFPVLASNTMFFLFEVYFQVNSGSPNTGMIFVTAFMVFVLAVCCYDCSGKQKYILLVIFCAVWVLVEFLTFFLLSGIKIEQERLNVIGIVISKLLMIIMVYVISVFWDKECREAVFNRYYLYLLFIPAGSICIAVSQDYSETNRFSSVLTMSILLLFNLIIFEIYIKMNELFISEREKMIYAQQMEMFSTNTMEQKKMMKDFHEQKHNLINALIVLKSRIENSQKEDVMRELDGIINNFHKTESISDSGNSTIDAIINSKYTVAKGLSIIFNMSIFVPEELPIEQCDIGIVLGNALDNAIDAVKNCGIKEKTIDIFMSVKKEALVMVIKNPFDHEIRRNNRGKIVTTKKEKYRHGYGLASIKKIAAKYQGDVVIDIEENIFCLTVVMNFE